MTNIVKGFKVFNSDWTCKNKKYTCPGKFEEEGDLDICGHGMHFCENLADCFLYNDFDPNKHVAEVIAYGEVLTDENKACTNKLEIVREMSWDEVQRLVNTGKNCTGLWNTGDYNTGNRNTGSRNTGDYNTGDWNIGDRNTGNWNTGNWNTGNWNTGNWNTGSRNTGDWNTGNRNTGSRNTGDWNTGNRNTGNWNTGSRNTGDYNTGDWNIGDRNTGDWNKSSHNTGCFNTEEPKILMFNKPSDWTYNDWCNSEARYILNQIPKNVVEWVDSDDMTEEEKTEHPTHECTGGYLKVLDESECGQLWWNELSDNDKDIITGLPNFDAVIFKECTGIDING